jgi:hypothetical protein
MSTAPSPPAAVRIEQVTAALVFQLRDYVPERDHFQLPQAAGQLAELYALMIYHQETLCALASLPPALALLIAATPAPARANGPPST